MKKVALGKQRSSSHHSIDKQRKDATGDGDNAEIQIITETYNAKNHTHEKKTIEGNGTKTGNSAKKFHNSETSLDEAISSRTDTIRDKGRDRKMLQL